MHPSVHPKVGGLDPGEGHTKGVAVKMAAAVASVSLAEQVEREKVSERPAGGGGAAGVLSNTLSPEERPL